MTEREKLMTLVADLARELLNRRWLCATAESCTGGGVAEALTALAGSSDWFERGFVTYSNESKQELLDVGAAIIRRHGAVSEATARAMAEGTMRRSRARATMAVTGIAGPSGGTADKPVGTVVFAWAVAGGDTTARTRHFDGDRQTVRQAATEHAIEGLLARLRQG